MQPSAVIQRPKAGCWRLEAHRRGVEQRQLVGLITQRSQVRVLPPLPASIAQRSPGEVIPSGAFSSFQGGLLICGNWDIFLISLPSMDQSVEAKGRSLL